MERAAIYPILNTITGLLRITLTSLVAPSGVEPEHPFEYQNLNLARLPIPPRGHFAIAGGNNVCLHYSVDDS